MKKTILSAIALCCLTLTAQIASASITQNFNWTPPANTSIAPGSELSFSFDTTGVISLGSATSAKLTLDFSSTDPNAHAALTIADGNLIGGMTFSGLAATMVDNSASLLTGLNDDGLLNVAVYAPPTSTNMFFVPGYGSFTFTTNGSPFAVENATLEVTGSPVPVPAAAWLLGSGLAGLLGLKRKSSEA